MATEHSQHTQRAKQPPLFLEETTAHNGILHHHTVLVHSCSSTEHRDLPLPVIKPEQFVHRDKVTRANAKAGAAVLGFGNQVKLKAIHLLIFF